MNFLIKNKNYYVKMSMTQNIFIMFKLNRNQGNRFLSNLFQFILILKYPKHELRTRVKHFFMIDDKNNILFYLLKNV
jgi:hypothetical protein